MRTAPCLRRFLSDKSYYNPPKFVFLTKFAVPLKRQFDRSIDRVFIVI